MSELQRAFEFVSKNKKAIKEFKDQELIKVYNRILMNLSKKVDEMELKLRESND